MKSLYLPTLFHFCIIARTLYLFEEKGHILFFLFSIRKNSIFSGEGTTSPNGKCGTYMLIYSKTDEKCIFEEHNSLRSGNMPRHIFTDHSKETDYIVGLVQSTSGQVFSLASLWWIRKECLVRFLLSLWCFQVIVHTSHPVTLVAPSGMSLTILSAQSH